jgi:hypothetical protein
MKTAVEWYNEEINKLNVGNDARVFIAKLLKQAKKMEKEQIMNAFYNARKNKSDCQIWNCEGSQKTYETFEQYYNETFKSE